MVISPITLKAAQEFIAQHHPTNKPPRSRKFSIRAEKRRGRTNRRCDGRSPVARHFDDGLTLEVNRTCTTGERNANSALYGQSGALPAQWAISAALHTPRLMGPARHCVLLVSCASKGYRLALAGLRQTGIEDKRDPVGNGGVPRVFVEIRRMK